MNMSTLKVPNNLPLWQFHDENLYTLYTDLRSRHELGTHDTTQSHFIYSRKRKHEIFSIKCMENR